MKIIEKNIKKKNNKCYISFEEREMIEKMLLQNISQRKIAKVLWRWKSTINDEIKRYSTYASWYEAHLAHKQFLKNQKNKWNISKINNNIKLKEYIITKLNEDWSPEEISWRIKNFHSDIYFDDYITYVCHETIYNFIYSKEWINLKLPKLLRQHKHKRTKWYSRKSSTVELIKDRVSIHERENIIEKRERVWDFESDSVIFPKQKQVLNTNICRVTRLARFELVNDKSALASIQVQKNIVFEMEELGVKIHSFTFDNWLENVLHTQLRDLWVNTYFCDAYCSYQKWSIENLNLLIRQYLPRNTDLSNITPHDIYIIQEKLNNRPRKCLGYLSPNEFFYKKTWVKPN